MLRTTSCSYVAYQYDRATKPPADDVRLQQLRSLGLRRQRTKSLGIIHRLSALLLRLPDTKLQHRVVDYLSLHQLIKLKYDRRRSWAPQEAAQQLIPSLYSATVNYFCSASPKH